MLLEQFDRDTRLPVHHQSWWGADLLGIALAGDGRRVRSGWQKPRRAGCGAPAGS